MPAGILFLLLLFMLFLSTRTLLQNQIHISVLLNLQKRFKKCMYLIHSSPVLCRSKRKNLLEKQLGDILRWLAADNIPGFIVSRSLTAYHPPETYYRHQAAYCSSPETGC
jgi:hypothetical protein